MGALIFALVAATVCAGLGALAALIRVHVEHVYLT